MNTPIIGSGFGNFSRVLGPWNDIFPTDLTLSNCQFGVGIGTEIAGGSTGATISAITIEPPFNVIGSLLNHNWRCLVLKGKIPASIYEYQRAARGWPIRGESDQKDVVLWSKMFSKKIAADNFAASIMSEHFFFPDLCGPSVGPGEIMSVLFVPLFNELVSVYGNNNSTYTSVSVYGVTARKEGESFGDTARSIPEGYL